jgi:glycogen debranching enzyme
LVAEHNRVWRHKVSEDFQKEALGCMAGAIRYYQLEERKCHISDANPMIKLYFRQLENPQKTKVAHTGWIMGAKPFEDFAEKGWHYLRRTINAWSDSVKLKYGAEPSDCPFLWGHMEKYVTSLAAMFDGFRLDNAHTTPLHVCQYMLQVARTVNP